MTKTLDAPDGENHGIGAYPILQRANLRENIHRARKVLLLRHRISEGSTCLPALLRGLYGNMGFYSWKESCLQCKWLEDPRPTQGTGACRDLSGDTSEILHRERVPALNTMSGNHRVGQVPDLTGCLETRWVCGHSRS